MAHRNYVLYRRYCNSYISETNVYPMSLYSDRVWGNYTEYELLMVLARYKYILEEILPKYSINSFKNGYFILDKDNNYVDIAPYMSTIIELRNSIEKDREEKRQKRLAIDAVIERHPGYQFRTGTVPYIRKCKWHRGCFYRKPKLYRVLRHNNAYKEFSRGSKRDLSNAMVFDEKVRHNDRSWKTSYKVRKQWMKHLNKHEDTINLENYYKGQDLEEVC